MKTTTIIATALLLLAVSPGLRAQDPTDLEDVVLYTNSDVEKLEPLPTGQPWVDTSFDTEAWEFVSAFIASERDAVSATGTELGDALDLDFVPVAEERYDLIVPTSFRNDKKVEVVLELIRTNTDFHDLILSLGGYNLRDCGNVMYEQQKTN